MRREGTPPRTSVLPFLSRTPLALALSSPFGKGSYAPACLPGQVSSSKGPGDSGVSKEEGGELVRNALRAQPLLSEQIRW